MYSFEYARPGTLDEAVALLAADPDARLLAGGQTLLPVLKHRLARISKLVDLRAVERLRGVGVRDGAVVIGAMTEHAAVAASAAVKGTIPALAQLAGGIGDPMVRNMGTIGGSLANSDPAADYPAAILGLGATIHTDRRMIGADDYFRGMFATALETDEVIVEIEFPVPRRSGYVKFANPASGYVVTGAFVADLGREIRVAVNGAGPCVFRHEGSERALTERFLPTALDDVAFLTEGLNADLHASAAYRAHLVRVAVRRAVTRALDG